MTYPKALRAEIVRLERTGRSAADLARQFGPAPSLETIRAWIQEDHPKDRPRMVVSHPALAAQFSADRNPGVDAGRLGTRSKRRLWWRCGAGHGWEATVANRCRAVGASGCPTCAGRFSAPLAVTHPQVAAQLRHPAEGNTVTAGSNRRLWWRCERGHVWEAQVQHRVIGKAACPACK